MTLHFNIDDEVFVNLLKAECPNIISSKIKVFLKICLENQLSVNYEDDSIYITGPNKPSLFRALCLLNSEINKDKVNCYSNEIIFKEVGPLFDFSRNAVMKVKKLKDFLIKIAKMGLNTCYLYMEDTYEIPDYPYFGYLRGKYSQNELKEVDQFAEVLGIEVIPCIQTLGHLANPLKWSFSEKIKDTEDVLLVGNDETYRFIESMIDSISSCFKSNKIHIGMDEAHGVGLGEYLNQNGFVNRMDMMIEHLQKVSSICRKFSKTPIIWSDMLIRLNSTGEGYYDTEVDFSTDLVKKIPDIEIVYWDYYHHDEETYDQMIDVHKKINKPLLFAGGIWIWNALAPNYSKTIDTSMKALKSCKRNKITSIIATLWGDDGGEIPHYTGLFGLQLFAEFMYNADPNIECIKDNFNKIHNLNPNYFLILDLFDMTPGVSKNNPDPNTISKIILYQDLLNPTFGKEVTEIDLKEHYQHLHSQLIEIVNVDDSNVEIQYMQQYYLKLVTLLIARLEKMELWGEYYQNSQRELMFIEINEIDTLIDDINELASYYRKWWLYWNKPFGLEIIDLRFGGLVQRMETYKVRLSQWASGQCEKLEEMEIKWLPNDSIGKKTENKLGFGFFKNAYSVSKLSDV